MYTHGSALARSRPKVPRLKISDSRDKVRRNVENASRISACQSWRCTLLLRSSCRKNHSVIPNVHLFHFPKMQTNLPIFGFGGSGSNVSPENKGQNCYNTWKMQEWLFQLHYSRRTTQFQRVETHLKQFVQHKMQKLKINICNMNWSQILEGDFF